MLFRLKIFNRLNYAGDCGRHRDILTSEDEEAAELRRAPAPRKKQRGQRISLVVCRIHNYSA
jgi:hypothetical protein